MSNSHVRAIEDYVKLRNRNAQSHAIRAARELGIFSSLREGQKNCIQLAEENNCNTVAVEKLMEVLVTTELVERYEHDFALSQIGRLIPAEFLDLGDGYWQELSNYVRTGLSIHEDPDLPQTEFDFVVQRATEEWMMTPVALDAAEVLGIGNHRKGQRIMEVCGGAAVLAVTMAHRDPTSTVVLLDTAEGLERADQTIHSIGLEGQIEKVVIEDPNDMIGADVEPNSFDVLLATNFLQTRPPAGCQRFFKTANAWLTQTGELVLVDVFPGQECGDVTRSVFGLELGLRTQAGQLYDPGQIKSMLNECGFAHVQFAHLPSPPNTYGLVLAG